MFQFLNFPAAKALGRAAACIGVAAVPGIAEAADYRPVNTYRVEAQSDYWVDLNLCNNPVVVDMRGDGDTDVDFWIYDDRNNQVFSDVDMDDNSVVTLNPPVRNGGCIVYRLKMHNYGNVWNGVQIRVGDNNTNGDAPSVGTYRVEANREFWVDLNLCRTSARIEIAGDGDTDVDYTIYDNNNRIVAQDLALNDRANFNLSVNARGGCRPYRLKLNNLGNVWNQVTVTIWEY